jgi:hypothetical protein
LSPSSRTRALGAVIGLTLVLLPVGAAQAQTNGDRQTSVASPPGADAASDNTTFSQDNRVARLMAFDSAATNVVPGDANGKRDVFLFERNGGFSLSGRLSLVSVSSRGAKANGDSVMPSLDGDTKRSPHCVTFESTATNLDRADRSSDRDVFLRDLRRRTTTLVSVGVRNARNSVVDGECEFVTFEASRSVWVRDLEAEKSHRIARGTDPDQQTSGKGVAYVRGGQIYYQAFQKVFNKGNPTVKRTARELLVSRGSAGRGNGPSRKPTMDDNGHYVAFESDATNLCRSLCKGISDDANGATDIFRRTISREAPTRDTMQMASFSYGNGDVPAQGNGPSNNPAMSGAGENIVFDSEATNLRQSADIADGNIDPNGPVRDIFYWNFPRKRGYGNVSRESRPGDELTRAEQVYNGPSTKPSASSRANFIGFTSAETGLSGEANGAGIPDVFQRFLGGGPEGD